AVHVSRRQPGRRPTGPARLRPHAADGTVGGRRRPGSLASAIGTSVAALGHMTMDLKVLKCGNCEELKLGVHATALGIVALCGLYNAAAWLSRREQHLALNTVLYTALIAFEQRHV